MAFGVSKIGLLKFDTSEKAVVERGRVVLERNQKNMAGLCQ